MKNSKIKVVVLLSAVFSVVAFGFTVKNKDARVLADQVVEIKGYKNWTKVNSTPQLMPDVVAKSCALYRAPSGDVVDSDTSPHLDKYITVYVNEIGRKAMMEEKNPKFPEGSVIVKEKLTNSMDEKPELLTVMIKKAQSFNTKAGDWEYMVVDGPGENVEGRGILANCQACHINKPQTDYIFRTYLPLTVEKKLE